LESNWRRWVQESGLTEWFVPGSLYPIKHWRYIAKLATPLPPPFHVYQAIAMLDYGPGTLIYGVALSEDDYPEPGGWMGLPLNTPFPGGFDVVGDVPVVYWG